MKKTFLFAAALLFAVLACEPETNPQDDQKEPVEQPGDDNQTPGEGEGDENQTPGEGEGNGDENQTPGEGDENQTPGDEPVTPAEPTFADYITEEEAVLYDDRWVPSSDEITVTATGAGKLDVDFACKEDPYEGENCIKWVMNCPVGTPADFIRLTFDPLVDLSGLEKKGNYCVEFAIKSNWWINGNVFNLQLRDSDKNVDGKPYLYQQNVIQDFDEDTPKSEESPEGTIPPGGWHRVSIPLNQIWGINNDPEGGLTKDDWTKDAKTTRNSSGDRWLPDLAGFGSLTFQSKAQAKDPEETDLIIWLDEIKICEASFAQNK